ncbi:hypothetical protein F3Y22_tig00113726pilonHSYRG00442 [Hibiscus syriacus]|uniref:Uncharacterized protein n=1 Tax=Hibiscus syriacus TaxID=106335 RepID=A0A6A2XGX4_HIBSY|nr:hypothetical protein F3Y22_tig00113726pilonHSYRG00442 [Hibiscus syriacus]
MKPKVLPSVKRQFSAKFNFHGGAVSISSWVHLMHPDLADLASDIDSGGGWNLRSRTRAPHARQVDDSDRWRRLSSIRVRTPEMSGAIDFWEDHWTEVTSLRESFPRIFRIANQKSGKSKTSRGWRRSAKMAWSVRWKYTSTSYCLVVSCVGAILQRLPTTVEPLKLEMLLEDSNLCAICKQHPESIVFPEDIKSMLFIWNGDSCRKEVKPVWLLSFFSFIGQFECIFKKSQFTEENIFDIGLLKTGVWANCKWPRLVPSVQDFIRCP